jgi:hypothetical protein
MLAEAVKASANADNPGAEARPTGTPIPPRTKAAQPSTEALGRRARTPRKRARDYFETDEPGTQRGRDGPVRPFSQRGNRSPTDRTQRAEAGTTERTDGTDAKSSRRTRVSTIRNAQRVRAANDGDEQMLGESPSDPAYLSVNTDSLFPMIVGPDDAFVPPGWLLTNMRKVDATLVPVPTKPDVIFETTDAALLHNTNLLTRLNFDFDLFMATNSDTTIGYNSEFRPLAQTESIFGRHPCFGFYRQIAIAGMDYRFSTHITETERTDELTKTLARGNHQSAEAELPVVARLLGKDVRHGFSLPFDPVVIERIPGAEVQPCGLAKQFTLNADGSRATKDRLTQDLSFWSGTFDRSVNSRIDLSAYPEMIYGWCLLRVIHFVVTLRKAHPDTRIFVAKFDFSDAYRRICHAASAMVKSIIVAAGIAYLALRLTFGGSPNPPTWCCVSEMLTDLANEVPLSPDWDPPLDPDQPFDEVPDDVPFGSACDMAFGVPVTVTFRCDCFVDDVIQAFLDTPRNRRLLPSIVPFVARVFFRPHAGEAEPVPRRPIFSPEKQAAEGTPAEIQIVLGWLLDTRRLLLALPTDKFRAWSDDIQIVIDSGVVTTHDLETIVGRLNHASHVLPLARHFLPRLRRRSQKSAPARQQATLSIEEIRDLRLWLRILAQAHAGISLNLLVRRRPQFIGWCDSCPYGLGGLLTNGRAWRIRVPAACVFYGDSTANNALEFLALGVTVMLLVIDAPHPMACLLAMGDSTSAIGWLFRASFTANDSPYAETCHFIARSIASSIIGAGHCLSSQHVPGAHNIVPDTLSFTHQQRDGKRNPLAFDDPPDDVLTRRFHLVMSQSIPATFAISPLPADVSSFAMQALRMLESSWIRKQSPLTRTRTGSGAGGPASATAPASEITPASTAYRTKDVNFSSSPSLPYTALPSGIGPADWLANAGSQWSAQLSGVPQASWLRRFGTVSNGAPFTSRTAASSPP